MVMFKTSNLRFQIVSGRILVWCDRTASRVRGRTTSCWWSRITQRHGWSCNWSYHLTIGDPASPHQKYGGAFTARTSAPNNWQTSDIASITTSLWKAAYTRATDSSQPPSLSCVSPQKLVSRGGKISGRLPRATWRNMTSIQKNNSRVVTHCRGVRVGRPSECARDRLPPRQLNICGATVRTNTVCAAQPHAIWTISWRAAHISGRYQAKTTSQKWRVELCDGWAPLQTRYDWCHPSYDITFGSSTTRDWSYEFATGGTTNYRPAIGRRCHEWSCDRSSDATIDRTIGDRTRRLIVWLVAGYHDWSCDRSLDDTTDRTISHTTPWWIVRSVIGRSDWRDDRSVIATASCTIAYDWSCHQ